MKRLLLLGLLLFAGATHAATEPPVKPLRVGLLPYLSTQRLLDSYAPLRDYLESALHRPVILITAPSFEMYVNRASQYEYDLYLTAPHFAALAESQSGYRRVSRLLRELDGSLIVARGGPVKTIADLKGRTVTTPDRLAIITMLGEALLQENNLMPGKDVTVQYTPSHNNAIVAVASGRADAAVVSGAVFDTMPLDVKERLEILTHTSKVPHMMFMASPKISLPDYLALRQAMLQFNASGAGKRFFDKSGYGDMGEIGDEQMRQLQPYIAILQQRIN